MKCCRISLWCDVTCLRKKAPILRSHWPHRVIFTCGALLHVNIEGTTRLLHWKDTLLLLLLFLLLTFSLLSQTLSNNLYCLSLLSSF